MNKRNIYQILPTISYGDAVSNDAINMNKVVLDLGFNGGIYAENIDPKVKDYVKHISKFRIKSTKDIIIHHFSTGSGVNDYVRSIKDVKKIIRYHNITPEEFFKGYNDVLFNLCKKGREQLNKGYKSYSIALADSEFNKKELDELNYKNILTLPIILNFDDYSVSPDSRTILKYNDGKTNFLFVGRIAPNKKQEDIIKSFYYYKKYIDKDSRLFIVGSYNGMERYYSELLNLVDYLKLKDVFFTGHTSFREIISYYKIASVFLCMSEHEGFCVPILESMYFNVPIIAYNSCAVPETLGDSGILVNKKDYRIIAETINLVVNNHDIRDKLVKKQAERLKEFDENKTKKRFAEFFKMIVGDKNG